MNPRPGRDAGVDCCAIAHARARGSLSCGQSICCVHDVARCTSQCHQNIFIRSVLNAYTAANSQALNLITHFGGTISLRERGVEYAVIIHCP